ncbi:MAG: PilZ domain-containing protein [Desulfatiglandales bacterium]
MDRREYFRIKDILRLSLKILPKDSPCPFSTQLYQHWQRTDLGPIQSKVEPELFNLLVSIDRKLNAILEHLLAERAGFGEGDYYEVDLSAGGLALFPKEEISVGDLVEVKAILNTVPPTYVIVYGRVKRSETTDTGRLKISMEFQNVAEELRSTLVRYVLQRQREIISGSR